MTSSKLRASLRTLAAEPANDRTDPWPGVRRRLMRTQQKRSVRVLNIPARAWAPAAVAILVVGIAGGGALFANQAQTASAAEALYQLQVEAVRTDATFGPCGAANGKPQGAPDAIAIQAGNGESGGPVTVANSDPAQLSDKLAEALGVSGDRVRQAMRQAIGPDLPSGPPPDPIASIAQQLGASTEQVCAAFSNGSPSGALGVGEQVAKGSGSAGPGTVLNINGTQIDMDSRDPSQVSGPAKKLGVSPERLLAVVKAAAPSPAPLTGPPNPNELINRLAQNLGMSPDKVRAAITQVEGPNRFYFAVPVRGPGN